MATVNQVLKIADDLKDLALREKEIQSILNSVTNKGDRLADELTQVQTKIANRKQLLKDAVAALE